MVRVARNGFWIRESLGPVFFIGVYKGVQGVYEGVRGVASFLNLPDHAVN